MSTLVMNETSEPSVPSSGKMTLFADANDEKWKVKDDQGFIQIITPDGLRDRNVVMNGDFGIYQRGTHTTTLTANRLYCADRWGLSIQTSNNTFTQTDTSSAPEVGYAPQYYGKFTQTTAVGKFLVSQVIEHNNMAHLRGQKVRLQIKARQSAGTNAVLRLLLLQLTSAGTIDTVTNTSFVSAWGANGVDPTFPANHTAITPDLVSEGCTISGSGCTTPSLTSTWTSYSAAFTVPSNAKNLIVVIASHNQQAINDVICIGEVGLRLGQEMRIWTPMAEALDLINCQRYFSKSFPVGVTPAASVALATGGYGSVGTVTRAGATAAATWIECRYPVKMRAAPATVTLYTPVTTGAQAYRFTGTAAAQTASAVSQKTDFNFVISATGDAAGVVGDLACVHWTADAEL